MALVLDELQPIKEFAAEVDRSERTIARWISLLGMPVVRIGQVPYATQESREWVKSGGATAQQFRPRRRGRRAA